MIVKEELQFHATNIRKRIAKYGYLSGRGHISSAMSCVEILTFLYLAGCMDLEKIKRQGIDRDRVILSKAHAGLALYATLVEGGFCDEAILEGFCTGNGRLATHPQIGICKGVEATGGSLGQGINMACGIAYAQKISGFNSNTYVLLGDGELQEGCVWEALLFASQYKLGNLTIMIDNNRRQISGRTEDIISVTSIKEKMDSFNLVTYEINGHDFEQLYDAFASKVPTAKVIVANTLKGKGISFMEDAHGWHGKGLTKEQYKIAMQELGND